jgi:E3 ubiquitin-protein ligase SIAH1
MAKQHKRGSPLDNGEHAQSSKKPRAQASPTAVVKCELPEGGRRREEQLEEGEVGQGGGAGAVVAMEVIEEPQLNNLRMGLALFHCRACQLPLEPPTFQVSLHLSVRRLQRNPNPLYFILFMRP